MPAGTARVSTLPPSSPVPGGIAVLPTGMEAASGRYRDNRIMLASHGGEQYAVIGIPLSARPGTERFSLTAADGASVTRSFQVQDKEYLEQHLTITNQRLVDPNADDLVRIRRESAEINRASSTWNTELQPVFTMSAPVEGRRSSSFGLRRFYNGQARNPHSGMDIAAPEGTPILAPAAGVVAAVGDYFFGGRTVILDHGHGLVSLYLHASVIDVEPGDRVRRGQRLALVGKTGRTTGPHLHWTMVLNNTRVDPALFLVD